MAQFKAVYIDARSSDADIERRVLAERDVDLVVASCRTDDEVAAVAGDADAILNLMYWMGRPLFARLPNLRVVVRQGVGVDNIDVDAATDAGVVVCNVIDYGFNEVANHAFAMLLALNRKLVPLDRAVRQARRPPPAEIMPHTGRVAGETLGLLSFGTIARAVARRAQGFDLTVLAHDPYVDPSVAHAAGVTLVSLDDLLRRSDYLSIHTPLSPETRGLIGARELDLMKPTALLVLTSRGGVVDEEALAERLRDGKLAGAGVDVFEHEPVAPDHPLLRLDNVVASPHYAFYSDTSVVALRHGFAESAADVLHGRMPHSLVNPTVLDRVPLKGL